MKHRTIEWIADGDVLAVGLPGTPRTPHVARLSPPKHFLGCKNLFTVKNSAGHHLMRRCAVCLFELLPPLFSAESARFRHDDVHDIHDIHTARDLLHIRYMYKYNIQI